MEPESLRASLSSEWRFFSVLNIVRAEQTNHRHAGLFGPPSTVVCGGVYLALLFSRCLRGDIIFVIVDKAIMAMFGSLMVGITEKTPKNSILRILLSSIAIVRPVLVEFSHSLFFSSCKVKEFEDLANDPF